VDGCVATWLLFADYQHGYLALTWLLFTDDTCTPRHAIVTYRHLINHTPTCIIHAHLLICTHVHTCTQTHTHTTHTHTNTQKRTHMESRWQRRRRCGLRPFARPCTGGVTRLTCLKTKRRPLPRYRTACCGAAFRSHSSYTPHTLRIHYSHTPHIRLQHSASSVASTLYLSHCICSCLSMGIEKFSKTKAIGRSATSSGSTHTCLYLSLSIYIYISIYLSMYLSIYLPSVSFFLSLFVQTHTRRHTYTHTHKPICIQHIYYLYI
jgi:hypothetical protein